MDHLRQYSAARVEDSEYIRFKDLGPVEIGFGQKQYGIGGKLVEKLPSGFQED